MSMLHNKILWHLDLIGFVFPVSCILIEVCEFKPASHLSKAKALLFAVLTDIYHDHWDSFCLCSSSEKCL